MKKILQTLLCAGALLLAPGAFAQEIGYDYVDILRRDKTVTRIELTPGMYSAFNYEDNAYDLVIYTIEYNDEGIRESKECARIPTTDISRLDFIPNEAYGSVNGIAGANLKVRILRNTLEVQPAGQPLDIAVFSLDGTMLASRSCAPDAVLSIDLSPYAPGAVIVKAGSFTSKFLLK
ncbi:MAG: hypothetical protein J6L73_00110 [Muribaculaceae bacterium]|nr:hypothetical protein [Muribaculaceae bacterium]